jgi:hypothetical protein
LYNCAGGFGRDVLHNGARQRKGNNNHCANQRDSPLV